MTRRTIQTGALVASTTTATLTMLHTEAATAEEAIHTLATEVVEEAAKALTTIGTITTTTTIKETQDSHVVVTHNIKEEEVVTPTIVVVAALQPIAVCLYLAYHNHTTKKIFQNFSKKLVLSQ